MKPRYPFAFLAALAIAATTHAACPNPKPPKNLPDGKTATMEKMVEAQKAVKQFDAATNDYVTCLQTEGDAEIARVDQGKGDDKKKADRKKKLSEAVLKKQNAAVDADKALAERFNEQLRLFKAQDSAKG